VCISIVGPQDTAKIKECMNEIREILRKCGGTLTQENVVDPLAVQRKKA
jgi:hypothetical protein